MFQFIAVLPGQAVQQQQQTKGIVRPDNLQ